MARERDLIWPTALPRVFSLGLFLFLSNPPIGRATIRDRIFWQPPYRTLSPSFRLCRFFQPLSLLHYLFISLSDQDGARHQVMKDDAAGYGGGSKARKIFSVGFSINSF